MPYLNSWHTLMNFVNLWELYTEWLELHTCWIVEKAPVNCWWRQEPPRLINCPHLVN